jgi:hypothetical protein
MHPAIASHPISGSTIMADILAYVQSGYAVNLQGDRQIESIFVHPSFHSDATCRLSLVPETGYAISVFFQELECRWRWRSDSVE